MGVPRIRADHDQLAQIARNFGNQADRVRSTQQSLNQNVQTLKSGDWIGKGATAFYREMDQTIFPAVKRLGEALSQAQKVTQQISRLMQEAEQSISAIFILEALGSALGGTGGAAGAGGFAGASASASASGSSSSGGGFWSQVGGFFEGVWEGAKGMVGGLFHAVTHPIDTLKGLAHAVTHPGELWDALKKPYVEDWQSGNYGRAIWRGAFEVAMLLIPGIGEAKAVGKGAEVASVAGKAAKAAEVAEAAGTVARGARAAEAAAGAGRAAELAEAAAVIARNQRIAS
ncbi:MAG TPA: WXG100 family type VII secretion target, partial [Anaerolineales bacterium]|nr:WXG100 family type VII secretion target [Anaerolineales bacterium]